LISTSILPHTYPVALRVMIYSDVHGNLPAFEAVLKDAGQCEMYISLGDLVNYGPWSNECVDLAFSLQNTVLLMGNHEEYFIQEYFPGENRLVRQFTECCLPRFKRQEQIRRFGEKYQLESFTCIHTIENRRLFADSAIVLHGNYCIGHSHQQFLVKNGGFELYNAGSVGQSRDRINLARYLLYYVDTKKFELRVIHYDVRPLLRKMEELKYPGDCMDYYYSKC
jgi:predicted phosphodiesterase